MLKHGIDQQALINQFADASAKQGAAVRTAVREATVKALQGRELTLTHVKQVLDTVTKATSAGAAKSALPMADVQALLAQAVAGIDVAMEQAVATHRRALEQALEQGATLRETQLKKAVGEVEKFEDAMFAAVRKAVGTAATPLQGPWTAVLDAMQAKGSGTGKLAATSVEQLLGMAQKNLREGRELSLKTSQVMLDSYATLVSGVLLGMSEALKGGGEATPSTTASARKR